VLLQIETHVELITDPGSRRRAHCALIDDS